jgi:hypothetical protein
MVRFNSSLTFANLTNGSSADHTQCHPFTNCSNALKGLLTVLPSISTWDFGQSFLIRAQFSQCLCTIILPWGKYC